MQTLMEESQVTDPASSDTRRALKVAVGTGVMLATAAIGAPIADAGVTPIVNGPQELWHQEGVWHQGSASIGGDCGNDICSATVEVEFKRFAFGGWGDVAGSKTQVRFDGKTWGTSRAKCAGKHKYSTMLKITLTDLEGNGGGVTVAGWGYDFNGSALQSGTNKMRSIHQPTLDCTK